MFLLRLAVRNLVRNLRRTVLTTTVIVFGVGLLILGQAFIGGLEENFIRASEEGLTGHITARPKDYPTQGMRHPVDELLEVPAAARTLLDARTVAWTERTLFAPTAIAGEDALRVRAIGYDPRRDPAVFPRQTWEVTGRDPAPGTDEVLVSKGVARLLELAPGDRIVLQVRTHKGAINALHVVASGVLATANSALDYLAILIPAPLAQRLVGSSSPSHVTARLAHRSQAEALKRDLAPAFGGAVEVITWHDDVEPLLRLQAIRRKSLNMLVFILLALAGFGIANTILIAAHERVREIGTLRALGMTAGAVIRMFLVEGGLMGLVGGLLGALWGGGLVAWWSRSPIDLREAMAAQDMNFQASAYLYLNFQGEVVVLAVAFGLAVAVLASIYPARSAAELAPADAVRAS